MKDILILVATNFEDTELISTINILNRENVSYDLVSIENKEMVKGQNEAFVETKKFNSKKDWTNYKSLFIPGGKGYELLIGDDEVIDLVKSYESKYLFAICAAPAILLKANVLDGVFTSYPGMAKDARNTGKEIEVTDRTITGRDFKATIKFAEEIIKKIKA